MLSHISKLLVSFNIAYFLYTPISYVIAYRLKDLSSNSVSNRDHFSLEITFIKLSAN